MREHILVFLHGKNSFSGSSRNLYDLLLVYY